MRPFSASTPALVESLIDDPFYQAITVDFGNDIVARKRALGLYFAYSLGEAARTGRCILDKDPALGAAAWLLPRSSEVDDTESSAKAKHLAGLLGPQGNENYHQILRFMGPLAAQVVPDHAWYLSIVGVLPSAQGRGIGAGLLADTLVEAQNSGASCYLETFSPRNFAFYERVGFKRIAVHLEPTTNAEYTLMRRDV
jgi:ribosomal protein S18 acetylase RimI-like enzyme